MIHLFRISRRIRFHSWLVTSTPSAKIIPTELKANQSLRVAFHTVSKSMSRIVIEDNGAETLNTPGEMIFKLYADQVRCEAMYIDMDFALEMFNKAGAKWANERYYFSRKTENSSKHEYEMENHINANNRDELFEEAARYIIDKDKASIGMIQRIFRIGFNRAARIMNQLCDAGVVGEEEGIKPRKVLMSMEMLEEYLNNV